MLFLWITVMIVHGLAAAAWFGAMVFTLTELHPRAKAYFRDPAAFEEFITVMSQRARWKVLTAFGLVGASGLVLAMWQWQTGLPGSVWAVLVLAKTGLYVAALALFAFASWRLWPRRIFAIGDEVSAIQRRFRQVGLSMIGLIGSSMVLGFLIHTLLRRG